MYPLPPASFFSTSIIDDVDDATLPIEEPNDIVLSIPERRALCEKETPRILGEASSVAVLTDTAIVRKFILDGASASF